MSLQARTGKQQVPERRSLIAVSSINCTALEMLWLVLIHILDVIWMKHIFLGLFRIKVNTIRTPKKAITLQHFSFSKKVFMVKYCDHT